MLFFGAHPDDVELNCGGTVLNLTESQKKVVIVDLTKGELSTRGNLNTRKKETTAATKLLGISGRENLNLKDGNIEINKTGKDKVIRALRKYKPELVFAPYPHDRHPDHIYAGNLIRECIFYSGLKKIVTGNLKPHKPKKIFYYRSAYEIPISFIIDISSVFHKKREVLKCFGSQFYNPEFNKKNKAEETFISSKYFDHEIESRARHFGFKIGVEFGEPFFSYEALKIDRKSLFEI
ncbi:MAG TPA: bacillithiol biosynthesis deacetylase BshB1 [Ignavibacteria bacterium]|mgnify:CR=1 FL=1|nr:bacillithiol biosynthesis deacetylase BshB1 [Ignavibacteria bacterium]